MAASTRVEEFERLRPHLLAVAYRPSPELSLMHENAGERRSAQPWPW